MKLTLELPDLLIKQVKLRALQEGSKFNDTVAELLQKGLDSEAGTIAAPPVIKRDKKTGLLRIECRHRAVLTPEQINDLLLEQEVIWASPDKINP